MGAPTFLPHSALPRPLRDFLLLTLLLTALCWLTALLSRLLGWGPPFNWPLFPRGSHYYDFVVYLDSLDLLRRNTGTGSPAITFAYFAPGIFPYRLFAVFGKVGGFFLYLGLVAASVLAGLVPFARALRRRGLSPSATTLFLAVTTLCSFPLLFCLERGNIEVLLAIGIAAGLAAFCTGRPLLAALLWGVFGSVKLYPLLLVALFVSRRQLRLALLTVATAILTNLAALAWIGPTIPLAWASSRRGTALFVGSYALTDRGQPWDHSLFALLKHPFQAALGIPFGSLLPAYILTLAALMLTLYFARIRRLPLPNQVILLSICCTLLPPTSYSYTLLQLYGAFAVLTLSILDSTRSHPLPADTAATPPTTRGRWQSLAMLLFAALFSPFNLVRVAGQGVEGQEKCLLLLALFAMALLEPFPGRTPALALHPAP